MKTEFEFHFSTYEFFFKKEHKFIATFNDVNSSDESVDSIDIDEFEFKIIPNEESIHSEETQRGSLFITLPLEPDHAKEKIWYLLHTIIEKINFNNPGKFEVNCAFYMGKRIPENDEEEQTIGDTPYFSEMTIVEYRGEPEFDSTSFASLSSNANDLVLIQQHNHASNIKHSIDKFVSYYKIIEDIFSTDKKISAKKLLLDSEPLKEIYLGAFNVEKTIEDYKEFIENIVSIRHKCSHLKRNSDFGYVLNDERIESEVDAFIGIMDYVTKELILIKDNV